MTITFGNKDFIVSYGLSSSNNRTASTNSNAAICCNLDSSLSIGLLFPFIFFIDLSELIATINIFPRSDALAKTSI